MNAVPLAGSTTTCGAFKFLNIEGRRIPGVERSSMADGRLHALISDSENLRWSRVAIYFVAKIIKYVYILG